METVVERPGALDVHKAQVTACVRVPGDGGGREQHVAEFQTTVAGLLTLRDWLTAHGVTQVTMEATGVFWKPVWAILEDEFELLAGQCSSRQAGPRTQDRCQGRRMDLPARRGRAVESELRAAQADPRAAQPHALSQDPDPGALAGGQPSAQGARGHRDQARLRRHGHPRQLRPGDARRARGRHHRPRGARRPGQGQAARKAPRAAGRLWRAASITCTPSGSARSSPTWTSSTSRSRVLPRRSGSRSPLSSQPLSCCARSPAFNGAQLR